MKISLILISILFSLSVLSQDVSLDVPIQLNKVDTITNGSFLVINDNKEIAIQRYEIGDMAHGGIIFYIDHTGVHGLVADTADITNAVIWRNQSPIQTNANSMAMGAGAMNTLLVTALQVAEDPTENFATLLCLRLDRGNYGDWYLPSIKELELLYINLHLAGLGNFPLPAFTYWSSSEDDKTHSYALNFSSGVSASELKDIFFAVRAIRSF